MSTSDLIRNYVRAETILQIVKQIDRDFPGKVSTFQMQAVELAADEAFDKLKEAVG